LCSGRAHLITGTLLVFALLRSEAGAQATQSDWISKDLVAALLGEGPFGRPGSIVAGAPPRQFPPELIPPRTQVLGHLPRGNAASTILVNDWPAATAIDSLRAHVRASGFTPAPETQGTAEGGFVSWRSLPSSTFFCRDREFVGIAANPRTGGGSRLTIVHTTEPGTPCAPQPADPNARRGLMPDGISVPTLGPPPDAVVVTAGMSRGGSVSGVTNFQMEATASTRLSVAEVLAHYSQQMRLAGWESVDSATTPTAGIHTFTRKNDAGHLWTLQIMATTFRGAPFVIDLYMQARQR
jgi:hypothetical protein